jgi:hypothetical protein
VRGTEFIELKELVRAGVRNRCQKLGTGNLSSGKTNSCHPVSRCRLGGLELVRRVCIWSIKLCDQTYKQDNCKPNQKAANLVGHPSETTELQRAKSISLYHQYIIITAKYLLRAYSSPARSISSLIVHAWSDNPLPSLVSYPSTSHAYRRNYTTPKIGWRVAYGAGGEDECSKSAGGSPQVFLATWERW